MLSQTNMVQKLIIGFALIFLLLAAALFIVYRSQSDGGRGGAVSGQAHGAFDALGAVREHEQAFLTQPDRNRAAKVRQALNNARQAAKKAGGLSTLQSSLSDYTKAFDAYAELAIQQSQLSARMEQTARLALDRAASVREREEAALESIRQRQIEDVNRQSVLVDEATAIYYTLLEAKVSRVSLMGNNQLNTMAQWKSRNKQLIDQVAALRNRLQRAELLPLTDQIVSLQKRYIDDVLGYLRSPQPRERQRMEQSVNKYTGAVIALQSSLQKQIDLLEQEAQGKIDEKMALVRMINEISHRLLTARLQEATMMRSGTTRGAAEVKRQITAIYDIAQGFAEKVEDQTIREQIASITVAVNDYADAVEAAVTLGSNQGRAHSQMINAARRLDVDGRARQPVDGKVSIAASHGSGAYLVAGIVLVVGAGIVFFVAFVLFVRPVRQTTDTLEQIVREEGDLTRRLDVNRQDEIGKMATGFNTLIGRFHDVVCQVDDSCETAQSRTQQYEEISGQMDAEVAKMDEQSTVAVHSAEAMKAKIESIAAAGEQTSQHVDQVAGSMEQMSEAVSKIGQSSDQAGTVTRRAVEEAQQASEKVGGLGVAAANISKVTQVIKDISDQTNLLALNATIEAARAGDAGRGFAVVANEIKELARQTAQATKDIKEEIEGIQHSTAETVADIGRIVEVIGQVDELVGAIGSAVEEQNAATAGIAENVTQAADGIEAVNQRVAESSSFSTEIAAEVGEVQRIAGDLADNSHRANTNAGDLMRLSDDLKTVVARFKVDRSSKSQTNRS